MTTMAAATTAELAAAPPTPAPPTPGPTNGTGPKVKRVRIEAGLQPDTVYAAALQPWRDALRKSIVAYLPEQSDWIASVQKDYRTKARDTFFFWSAIFGTHTFFTAFLPLLFFMGEHEKARGLIFVVGVGIYLSCVIKDITCTPRPYAPPVTRLSVSNHHREYGFPSSHSTNSISIALFLGQWLYEERASAGVTWVTLGLIGLAFYFVSVAGGRIYTGMHSMPDIIGGTILGTFCWALWIPLRERITAWVETGSLMVPIIMVPITLALVHVHPETPDDCPCFEDAIAILAVILGVTMGHLFSVREPGLIVFGPSIWRFGVLWAIPLILLRIVVGIGAIFLWRLVMKSTLLKVLPRVFRLFSKVLDVELPTRRFYLAATKYNEAETPIRPIPSFAEFGQIREIVPGQDSPSHAVSPMHIARSPSPLNLEKSALHMRMKHKATAKVANGNGNGYESTDSASTASTPSVNQVNQQERDRREELKGSLGRKPPTIHYDAEVLTKVVVYTGIGLLATAVMPTSFPVIERFLGFP